jgi:hypothetical protein
VEKNKFLQVIKLTILMVMPIFKHACIASLFHARGDGCHPELHWYDAFVHDVERMEKG